SDRLKRLLLVAKRNPTNTSASLHSSSDYGCASAWPASAASALAKSDLRKTVAIVMFRNKRVSILDGLRDCFVTALLAITNNQRILKTSTRRKHPRLRAAHR